MVPITNLRRRFTKGQDKRIGCSINALTCGSLEKKHPLTTGQLRSSFFHYVCGNVAAPPAGPASCEVAGAQKKP